MPSSTKPFSNTAERSSRVLPSSAPASMVSPWPLAPPRPVTAVPPPVICAMIHPKLTHGQASGGVLNKALKAKLSFSAFAANCVKTPQFCRSVFAAGASAGRRLGAAGYVRLIYTSRDENQARVQTLDPVADTEDDAALPNSDLAIQQTGSLPRLFIYSAYSAPLRVATLTATGSLGAAVVAVSTTGSPSGVTAVEIIEGGATD